MIGLGLFLSGIVSFLVFANTMYQRSGCDTDRMRDLMSELSDEEAFVVYWWLVGSGVLAFAGALLMVFGY
jgi:hypothetical protein